MTLAEGIRRYLTEPTDVHFMALGSLIVRSNNYSPYTSAQEVAAPYLGREDYQGAIGQLRALLPGALLSPALHNLLAFAYDQLGDIESSRREALFAKVAIEGILLTGEGSEQAPYHVLRIQDEYDVLAHLGTKSVSQDVIHKDTRPYDHHRCEDGQSIWFDIGAFYTSSAPSGDSTLISRG